MALVVCLSAQKLEINELEVDVYSTKSKQFSKKVSLNMILTDRDVEEFSYKVIDAINVIIGSFSVEDLLTSKGKEAFKKALIRYSSKTYSVEIDNIYIQKMYVATNPKVQDIVNALRQEGCCNMGNSKDESSDDVE